MTSYMKALCGVIALGIAIYTLVGKKLVPSVIVGCYWISVTMYWFFNFIGG